MKHIEKPTKATFVCPPEWPEAGEVLHGEVVKAGKTYADVKWAEGRVERVQFRAPGGVVLEP
jgi:hypothetical protein